MILKTIRTPSDKPPAVRRDTFETATSRPRSEGSLAGAASRYRPQVVVASLVVAALLGGAFYAARLSESAPRVVYSASLEEVAREARSPLRVDINTADAEELEELPHVGPATARAIIEYRSANGYFRSVEELEEVSGIGPATLEEIEPFASV